jgi:hypothetical protein
LQQRLEMVDEIFRSLGKDYTVSVDPDLPNIISGPDLLIGGSGSLLGVFLQRYRESNSPDSLLSRLALSKLALPSHFVSVLVLQNDQPPSNVLLSEHFDLVLRGPQIRELRHFIRSGYRPKQILLRSRQQALKRFGRLYAENRERIQNVERETKPFSVFERLLESNRYQSVQTPSWVANKRTWSHSPRFLLEGRIVFAATSFETDAAQLQRLRAYCNYSVHWDYSLDQGVPYPYKPFIKVLLVDRIPAYVLDPLKPLRAATFAGLFLLQASDVDEVERIAKNLNSNL